MTRGEAGPQTFSSILFPYGRIPIERANGMGRYLNPDNGKFISYHSDDIFVDKSLLIKETNASLGKEARKFMCVTRPRRFGKTLALSMLCAYYSKGCDSKGLFKGLKIEDDPSFEQNLNKRNVILIDMASIYTGIRSKETFFSELESALLDEFKSEFPSLLTGKENTIGKCVVKVSMSLNEKFVFLIDEWDVIYREQGKNKKLCDEYTEFLRNLFKSYDVASCIDLVYMTGILPIRRYNTQSALNMFVECNMLEPRGLAPHFGFTEDEVKGLCEKYGMDFSEVKNWYDGYKLDGLEVYNPKSVVEAMTLHKCGDYWVATSAIEAITDYMNYDQGVLKGAIASMLSGDAIELDPGKFGNDLSQIDSKDAALTVLIHLGYLAYLPPEIAGERGSCYIPNKEISLEFERALEKLDWHDIYDPIGNSSKLYKKTMEGDASFVSQTLDRNHEELASQVSKYDENVLSVVVVASYYKARDHYEVRKEENSINGRSDVSFYPRRAGYPPFIVELKIGRSPEAALAQIKKMAYWKAWPNYKGKVLLVGINATKKGLRHSTKLEWIEVS